MPFFEPVWYNRVLVNWPRAHSGVLQLTEASYLGPDSPRKSPRNETVKQCRLQMTVANSPVLWPSWTWCRIWWNHSWDSSRVTLNQRCFVFIRPCTHQVYRYYVISQTQSHSAVFGCSPIGVDGVALRVLVDLGQPGSVSKFPSFLWVKLWVGWVGRGYTEISRYFPASGINWVTLVTKIKLLYSLRF